MGKQVKMNEKIKYELCVYRSNVGLQSETVTHMKRAVLQHIVDSPGLMNTLPCFFFFFFFAKNETKAIREFDFNACSNTMIHSNSCCFNSRVKKATELLVFLICNIIRCLNVNNDNLIAQYLALFLLQARNRNTYPFQKKKKRSQI